VRKEKGIGLIDHFRIEEKDEGGERLIKEEWWVSEKKKEDGKKERGEIVY